MTVNDVSWAHEWRYSKLLGVVDDCLGTFLTLLLEGALVTLFLVQLVEKVNVGLTVFQVVAEVVHLLAVVAVSQVVIEPSEEKLIRGELKEITQLLVLTLQADEEWVVLKVDQGGQLDLDDLPHQTQDDVLSLVSDEVGLDVDNNDTDGL